jgi:hypothetical protein
MFASVFIAIRPGNRRMPTCKHLSGKHLCVWQSPHLAYIFPASSHREIGLELR